MKLSGDVVVTGGAGAIGSNLVRRILGEPEVERLFVIDDLSSGFEWLLPPISPRLVVCDRSIIEEDVLWATPPKEPIVFHLAAHFANALSVEEPVDDAVTNALGTLMMLERAEAWRTRLFVFASAGCALGRQDTPYQIHKALGETYCAYYRRRGLGTAVFRFHNSYGPGELPGEWRNVVPRWIWSAMNGEPLTIFGDGSDARDFVYVDDVVEELVRAVPLEQPRELGTGVLTTVRDLAWALCEEGDVQTTEIVRGRRTWDHHGRPCPTPILNAVPLREGLRRTWAWFRANEAKIRESL